MASFLFVTCQAGAEKLLKDEVARQVPELKPAYSRPGIVTFKREQPLQPDYRLQSVFARSTGVSYERLPIATLDAQTLLAALPEQALQAHIVHVFARDHALPGDDDRAPNPLAEIALGVRAKLAAAGRFEARDMARARELVIDVVVVEEDACLVGLHRHGPGVSPYPGGKPPLVLPDNAPSRAYLKLREALLVFDLDPLSGQVGVEVGASPGGAAFALLEAGMNVTGIDPAEADVRLFERSTEQAQYTHIRKPFAQVSRAELPPQVHWLLVDINEAPEVTVGAAEKFVSMLKPKPVQLLLTLKLTQPRFAEDIPDFIKRVRLLGYRRVLARQLAFGRREVVLSATQ